MTFTKLKIGIQTQNTLTINGTKDKTITTVNLFHQTTPLPTFARNVIYTVMTPPKFGLIYVNGYPEYAKEMDSFTQQDIDKQLIRYRTYHTCYSSFVDVFEFMVTVPECEDVFGTMKIIYNPPTALANSLSYQTRETLYVSEGDRAQLTQRHFEVFFNKFNFLVLKLSVVPLNGVLCNYNAETLKITQIDSFTLEKLYGGEIFYCHDDSETTKDTMQFMVLSDVDKDFQYVCELLIEISPINDNAPMRLGGDVFHVVRNSTKILNSIDLQYIDPDIDTNATEIVYTNIASANLRLDDIASGKALDRFTQDDIDHGRILVKHLDGTDIGNVTFVVTDGQFYVPGALTVSASDPFIQISERNATVVQEGKYLLIKMNDLAIETNLNIRPDEVDYTILSGPSYGVLKTLRRKFNGTLALRANNSTSAKNFTQMDVVRERLVYWNTDVASMEKIR